MRGIALLLALLAGCGNYSNEDLEFMNALPTGDDLRATSPAGASAIVIIDPAAAELARLTHQVTRDFNLLVTGILTIVDLVRSYPPTTRVPNRRTWGPANDNDPLHAGWQWRLIMWRMAGDNTQFFYEIDFHKIGTADTDWLTFLTGSFEAAATARHGTGSFQVVTAAVRAAGLGHKPDDFLDHLEVQYQLGGADLWVHLDFTNLPNPDKPDALMQASYDYRAAGDGRRQMMFDAQGYTVPGPLLDRGTAVSRWLDTGEGKATMSLVEGEGAGLMRTQCWNRQLHQTYDITDWDITQDSGDPSLCPDIAPLP